MNNYVQYDLYLVQPVKMGSQGNQSNADALSYLAGSTLRGAFISRMISKYFKDVKDLNHDKNAASLLFRDTRFFDAFLSKKGKKLIPVPAVYYAGKYALRDVEKERAMGNYIPLPVVAREDSDPAEGDVRVDFGKYCTLTEDTCEVAGTRMCANLHIAVATEEEKGKMFRYEAIERGQTFTGYIACRNEETAQMYADAIADAEMYIGGSKGSGYGLVKVRNVKMLSYEDMLTAYQVPISSENAKHHILTIYALSNLLLLDKDGKTIASPDISYLEEKLHIQNMKLQKSYISLIRAAGFNHMWRAGNVQQTAIKAGSYFRFSYEGTLDSQLVNELEEKGIGSRKQEGFGRILINVSLSQTNRKEFKADEESEENVVLTDREKTVLAQLQKDINQKRIHQAVRSAALDAADFYVRRKADMHQTQLSRLYNVLSECDVNHYDEKEAAARLGIFWNSLFTENSLHQKRMKSADKTYTEIRVPVNKREVTLKDLVEDVLDDHISAEVLVPDVHSIKIWGNYDYCDYAVKSMFLKEYLYNILRKAGDRK